MSQKKHTYQSLLQMGYTKEEIHKVLHGLMLAHIQYEKEHATKRKFLRQIQLFRFRPITGKALSLLKTLFAKKPKNPV